MIPKLPILFIWFLNVSLWQVKEIVRGIHLSQKESLVEMRSFRKIQNSIVWVAASIWLFSPSFLSLLQSYSGIPMGGGRGEQCCRNLSSYAMWSLSLTSRSICSLESKASEPALPAAHHSGGEGEGLHYIGAQDPALLSIFPPGRKATVGLTVEVQSIWMKAANGCFYSFLFQLPPNPYQPQCTGASTAILHPGLVVSRLEDSSR